MSIESIPGTEYKYGLISFDKQGHERGDGGKLTSETLLERAANGGITDVFFFCHGWKGDIPAAKDQYNRWMGAFVRSPDLKRAATELPGFSPLLIGLHWPSQPWGDEDAGGADSFAAGNGATAEGLLQSYLDVLGDEPAIRAPLEIIINEARRNAAATELPPAMRKAYADLNQALGLESKGVDGPPDADREGFDPDEVVSDGASFGGLGDMKILSPLRQLSYWTMKKRARSIGEGGMHDFLVKLLTRSTARVHLMGHSFGTIVVSSMIGGPDGKAVLPRPVNSLTLVQGAVSLWCYAASIPFKKTASGYFNRILVDKKISGPIAVTRSKFDNAVGKLYPFASRIHGSVEFDATPEGYPEYGAIGAFGLRGITVFEDGKMLPADGSYGFAKQKVYNIESSQFIAHGDGLSGAHSDIDGPEVAHMIWETALASH